MYRPDQTRCRAWPARHGFTLVEVLIAMSILAMLSLLSFRGVSALLDAEAGMRTTAVRLNALERFFSEFESTVTFAMPREVWNSRNEFEAAFFAGQDGSRPGGYRISASRFASMPGDSPYRTSYVLAPPAVELIVQSQLDAPPDAQLQPVTVLEGVRSVGVRVLSTDGKWLDSWPPAGAPKNILPRAVELTLDIDGLGPVTRLVARP